MEQVNTAQTALFPFEPVRSYLETIKKKTVALGGYKSDALLEYLSNPRFKAVGHWTEVDVLVQVFDGRISDSGRTLMRKRLARAFHQFRAKGYLLLLDRPNGWTTMRAKLMDSMNEIDKALAKEQIEAMQELCEQRDNRLDEAAALAGFELRWDEPNKDS